MLIREEETLKLHTAPTGEIWYADAAHAPRSSGLVLADFLQDRNWLSRERSIRVLGLVANAALIKELYVRQLSQLIGRIELAGPLVCETAAERCNPEIALFRMRQCLLSASLGGWHAMTERDYPSYALASYLAGTDDYADEHAVRILQTHPAWPDLTFIRGVDPRNCARLLARTLDPRWYINPQFPERVAKLDEFLGLDPKTVHAVSDSKRTPGGGREQRCRITLGSWKTNDPPGTAERSIPANFLWRTWFAAGGGPKGDLRASQQFVAYLRHTWLQALCKGQVNNLFAPDLLFKTLEERSAYLAHVAGQEK